MTVVVDHMVFLSLDLTHIDVVWKFLVLFGERAEPTNERAELTTTFAKDDGKTEFNPGSTLSYDSLDSTLPMAFDNDRLFDPDEGYYHLLKLATDRMNNWPSKNETFRAPDKEMGL
jgi:hypothetical protein